MKLDIQRKGQKVWAWGLVGVFSVIVQLQTSQRFVCSSITDPCVTTKVASSSAVAGVYSGPGQMLGCHIHIVTGGGRGGEGGAPGQHHTRPGHRAADKMRNGPRISWSWCGHAVGGDTGRWPPGHSCQQNIHSHSCASFLISEQ